MGREEGEGKEGREAGEGRGWRGGEGRSFSPGTTTGLYIPLLVYSASKALQASIHAATQSKCIYR